MRGLSRFERLLFPTALLSSALGLIIAPSSGGPLGSTTVCAAETCVTAADHTCVTENGAFPNQKAGS